MLQHNTTILNSNSQIFVCRVTYIFLPCSGSSRQCLEDMLLCSTAPLPCTLMLTQYSFPQWREVKVLVL